MPILGDLPGIIDISVCISRLLFKNKSDLADGSANDVSENQSPSHEKHLLTGH